MLRGRHLSPEVVLVLVVLAGGAAGAAVAPRSHHLDPFVVVVIAMAAASALAASLVLLEPAFIITGGLMLSVFSGNWTNMGIPLPLDRLALTCGIGSALIRSLRAERRRPEVRAVHWVMLLLILYAVASAAWSHTLTSSAPLFTLLDRLGVYPFLLYFVAPTAFGSAHQRRILAVGLLIIGAYLGLITLFEAVGLRGLVLPSYILDPSLGIHSDRARGPFLEAGANGLAMFACLVGAAITFPSWRQTRMRVLVIGVVALCVAGILFTVTRQIWLGAAVGSLVAMMTDRRLRRLLVPTAVGAAVVVSVALALVPGLSANVSSRAGAQGPVWDRLNSDGAALRMVEARPALGFGWGQFGRTSGPYYRLSTSYPLTGVGVAHNMPLSNASELGLVGIALWAAAMLMGLGAPMLGRLAPSQEMWRLGLIAISVAWFVQANFTPLDYAFDNYVVWVFGGVVAGLASAQAETRSPGASARSAPHRGVGLVAAES